MVLAGRGYGKTRTGAEWLREKVERHPQCRIALVAATSADCRETMIEGDSGLLSIFPPGRRPRWEPSKRRLTFANGALATTYSAEEPERLRGPQHHFAWSDELCAWKYPQETWDMLQFGLRLGEQPQQIVTTTPKPIKTLRKILSMPSTRITRGNTYENEANLAPAFIAEVIAPYEGTRLGRQEIEAEVLEDVEGALWYRDWFDRHRVTHIANRDLVRVVVAVDPAVTATQASDETGIVVAAKGVDGRGYVLDDLSCRVSPDAWASRTVGAYHQYEADRIIGEANNGGDLIERMIRLVDPRASYRKVNASRGKIARAEPIAALYERGLISHVGTFARMEDECCSYTGAPGEMSPNRMDALVWALSELFIENRTGGPKVRRL